MNSASRFLRHSLAIIMLALTAGCTSTASDGIAVSDVAANALPDCRDVVIEPFAPVNRLDTDGFDADYSRIEADLFTITLTRMLAGSGPREQVPLISDGFASGACALGGRVVQSTPDLLEIQALLTDREHRLLLSRRYQSAAEGPDQRFREIAAGMAADLSAPLPGGSDSASAGLPRSGPPGTGARAYSGLFADVVSRYRDIHYDDLIEPFSAGRPFAKAESDSLAILEKEIVNRQIQGVAAVAETIVLHCSERRSALREPLRALLENRPFMSYSRFQPMPEHTRPASQDRKPDVVIDDENGRYRLTAGAQTYALNGTPEQQYRLWRQMIADICDDSYEPMDREGAAGF